MAGTIAAGLGESRVEEGPQLLDLRKPPVRSRAQRERAAVTVGLVPGQRSIVIAARPLQAGRWIEDDAVADPDEPIPWPCGRGARPIVAAMAVPPSHPRRHHPRD